MSIATLRTASARQLPPAIDRACLAARVAADLKAKDVRVLDMRGVTPLYDFMVLATGTSRRQIHAIAEASKQDDYRLRTVIEYFVLSDLFLKR